MTPDEFKAKFRKEAKPWLSMAADSLYRFQHRVVYHLGGDTLGTMLFWYLVGTSAIGTSLLIWWVL